MDNEQLLRQIGGMFGQVNQHTMETRLNQRMDTLESQLTERLDGIDERLDGIDERLDGIDERLDQVEGRLDQVESTLTRVAVTQENVVLPALKQLAEGHEELTRQIGVGATQGERNTETIELHTVQIAGLQEKVKALA